MTLMRLFTWMYSFMHFEIDSMWEDFLTLITKISFLSGVCLYLIADCSHMVYHLNEFSCAYSNFLLLRIFLDIDCTEMVSHLSVFACASLNWILLGKPLNIEDKEMVSCLSVFSYVPSNDLLVGKPLDIGCKHVVSHLNVISCAFSIYVLLWRPLDINSKDMGFHQYVFKLLVMVKAFWHSLHGYGFSPECVFICFFIALPSENTDYNEMFSRLSVFSYGSSIYWLVKKSLDI